MKTQQILSMAAVLGTSASLHAAAVIYEPFAGTAGSNELQADTGGTGLAPNTWSGGNFNVVSGSPSWGTLSTSGNRAEADERGTASIGTGSTLNGMLDNGDTLWFSMLMTTPSDVGNGNADTGFALGDAAIGNNNNLGIGTGKQALGFTIKNGRLRPGSWDTGSVQRGPNDNSGGPALSNSTDYFVVGRMTFNASGTADVIDIFLPGTDLILPTQAVATWSDDLDQTDFNTISYGRKGDGATRFFDEIRFGASYADVSPVPEPATTALLGLGGLALILRRRK